MLIHDLIRLGSPLLGSNGFDSKEILSLIGDFNSQKVKNHFRHVIVIELPASGRKKAKALLIQEFGEEVTVDVKGKKKSDFVPDVERAVGIPFTVPTGGNPLNPQGRYGIPVYPCWTKHLDSFAKSPVEVVNFLSLKKSKPPRLDRTPNFDLSPKELDEIGDAVHNICKEHPFSGKKGKHLGLLLLVRCGGSESPFQYSKEVNARNRIGKSLLENGKSIVPNYDACLMAAWEAKEEEGAEKGEIENGQCSYSNQNENVISPYCKAWPWAGLTWDCPLPNGGDEKHLIEGIALSRESYRGLSLGARLFYRLSMHVDWDVMREVFSPSENRSGKDLAQLRDAKKLPTINGTAFLLPLLDENNPSNQKRFAKGIRGMLNTTSHSKDWAECQMRTVAGFDAFLPPDFANNNDYRLSLVYFSVGGQETDVHIRCTIEDVVPSTVGQIRKLATDVGRDAMTMFSEINRTMPDGRKAYLDRCFRSVPYLLSRAYGGGFLWQQLERVLHRRPLDTSRPNKNMAMRIGSLVTKFPDSRFDILDEVAFMLIFRDFANRYNYEIADYLPAEEIQMRPWKELIEIFGRGSIEELDPDSIAEIGFLSGMIVRKFSGWFASSMGGKADYLRDRVLTFGASVSTREVGKAVRGIRELAFRYPELKKKVELGQLAYYEDKDDRKDAVGDFSRRLGAVIALLEQKESEIAKNKDGFMNGFWSGYSLQGYDYIPKSKSKPQKKIEKEPVG